MKLKVGVAVLCLILGLIGYVLYVSIETYEETVNQGWSAKAKRNPFLALQQYLQLRGNTVQSSARMAQLDQLPDSGVILITDTRQLKKADRLSALRQWMEQGGNLVVGAHISSGDEKNALLEQFSVSKE